MQGNGRRSRTSLVLIALAFMSLICAIPLLGQNGSLTVTSLCTIKKDPRSFDGQSVTVRARLISDGMHGTTIYDESCRDFGLHLFLSSNAQGKGALETVLTWCHPSTRGKLITGTFTGIIQLRDGTPFERQITVRRIEDLTAKSTRTSSATFPTPCPDPPPLDLR